METKTHQRLTSTKVATSILTVCSLTAGFFLHSDMARASKAPLKQKTLSITDSFGGKGFLKNPEVLKTRGGSGLGRVTFKVESGPCVYVSSKAWATNGIGLYTTSEAPTYCTVYASKAKDKKYSSAISKSILIHFDHLPGYYKNQTVEQMIPLELGYWSKTEGRLSAPEGNIYFNELVKASQESSVRYAPYWFTLHTFWLQRLLALNSTDAYFTAKFEELAYRGMSDSGAARILIEKAIIQKDLKTAVQAQISETWANYQRDLNSTYK